MATFKAVLFDGYGTLFEGTVENWMVFCTRIVLEQGIRMAPEAFLKAWGGHLFPLFRGADFVTLREAHINSLERLFEGLGIEGPVRRYVDMIFDYLNGAPIYPDVKPTLARLDGFQPGIVSNADLENIEGVLGVHGLRFPVVVISESARVYKPDPAIFHKALDLLGCRPGEALYVGDSPEDDIVGAGRAGMRVAWLNRRRKPLPAGVPKPDYEIHTLAEVLEIVSG